MGQHRLSAWLVAYDIADEKRLVRVHRYLRNEALAIQYSVFAGAWSDTGLTRVEQELCNLIDWSEDDLRFYPLPDDAEIHMVGDVRPAAGPLVVSGLPVLLRLQQGAAQQILAMLEESKRNQKNSEFE